MELYLQFRVVNAVIYLMPSSEVISLSWQSISVIAAASSLEILPSPSVSKFSTQYDLNFSSAK